MLFCSVINMSQQLDCYGRMKASSSSSPSSSEREVIVPFGFNT